MWARRELGAVSGIFGLPAFQSLWERTRLCTFSLLMYLSSIAAFQKSLGKAGWEDELLDQMISSFTEKVACPSWWAEWCLVSFRMHPRPQLDLSSHTLVQSWNGFPLSLQSLSIYGWCSSVYLYTDQNLLQVWKLSQLSLPHKELVSFWNSVLWVH